MTSPQRLNDEMVGLWRTEFVHHSLYAQDAYARALQFALMRPGLIAAWGGGVDIATPALVDVSGNGMHLTFNGNAALDVQTNRPFIPHVTLDGTGDYLSRADEAKLDILGTSAALAAALRGLTFAAWARFDNTAAANEVVGSKWNATGNLRSWILFRDATGHLDGRVSNAGTTGDAVATGTAVLAEDTWYHVALVFSPSAYLRVYLNGAVEAADTSSVPASLFNSSAALVLGADGAFASLMTGDFTLPWLAAGITSEDLIFHHYHMTRHLLGA